MNTRSPQRKTRRNRFWAGVPPWILIGSVVILLPMVTLMTVETLHRQKKNSIRLLEEKGAALIRSFEAGTRTGMMGAYWKNFQLQKLLTETAQQPDIAYLLVTDRVGRILAHNDPRQIGRLYGRNLDLEAAAQMKTVDHRMIPVGKDRFVFEVFRAFSPTGMPMMQHRGRMWLNLPSRHGRGDPQGTEFIPQVIFVGLDMTAVEEARKSEARQTLILGTILLLIGFAGVFLLFLAQSYRSAKASLSKIKAFSDTVVEHMPIALVAVDSHRRVASMNRVAGAILKQPIADAVGRDAGDILPEEFLEAIERMAEGNGMMEKEMRCTLPGGERIPVEVSASLLRDNGAITGSILLFRDLTEVHGLRQEIVRHQRMATVGRLAAGVAHEVRNPLSSIKGFATYFKERYRNVAEDQQISAIMIQEVDRINRVVGQLLEFARPIVVAKKNIAVRPLIRDSLKLIEKQAREQKIRLSTDFSPDIDKVFIDPDRINQVLLNLYLNALESMEDGGVLAVSVHAGSEKAEFEIRVADTGAGIGAEDLAHVFDPYFTTKPAGTGLGLAITNNIIEAHGGRISFESRPGRGTTVTVSLPLKAGAGQGAYSV